MLTTTGVAAPVVCAGMVAAIWSTPSMPSSNGLTYVTREAKPPILTAAAGSEDRHRRIRRQGACRNYVPSTGLACVGIDASPVTYRLIASPTFAALVVELMVTAFVKISEFGTMVRVGK